MSSRKYRVSLKVAVLCAAFLGASSVGFAQVPTPTPSPGTPPGTERPNPAAPPATQQPAPQAPPATQQPAPQAPPGQPIVPGVTPQTPPAPQAPAVVPSPTPAPDVDTTQEPPEPNVPVQTAKPLPPLPNLSRLGVTSDNPLTLSLNDAVKKALENNNDIEVARDDVRFAETQLRALEGVFDPIFSITPQYDKRITPQQSVLGGSGQAGATSTTTLTWSPSVF